MALIIISVTAMETIPPPFEKGGQEGFSGCWWLISVFKSPLNPPFLKGEISHNDLNGTTIKATKIYLRLGKFMNYSLRTETQAVHFLHSLQFLSI